MHYAFFPYNAPTMLGFLRKLIPERSPVRLMYHKINAVLAALYYRFPSNHLKVIAVTGTSGKTTTSGLVHHLMQEGGIKTGLICTSHFQIGDKFLPNKSLRTTLRCWHTQKLLRKMVKAKCQFVVIETSSHALDQDRLWGVNIDCALLTNISNNEHLDYHGTFAEYVQAKLKLFRSLNFHPRKPGIQKMAILNRDDEQYEIFNEVPADRKWTYSLARNADFLARDIQLSENKSQFTLPLPNHILQLETRMIGKHNVQNLLAAITTAVTWGVDVTRIPQILKDFGGVPGRLEAVHEGQPFGCVIDFSYKPSAIKAVLQSLQPLVKGRIITVWGGAGGRAVSNWEESAELLDQLSDEIVLTTDDPYDEDPRHIAKIIRARINRKEGDRFFEIEDRYEAIRYALYTANPGDIVLIAGRGHEKVQTIGKQKVHFDDREVAREILKGARKKEMF